ncbi:MAG: DEAD/DEAH box helicase, partial [Planctomycetaceae bacterium]|nr:DEAD/DEAH box helicase [Planctomycetaceae bacterium]
MTESSIPSFKDLGLKPATLKTLQKIGYEKPSPIQSAFIPIALTGDDCIGQARTGTGKTAAFMLPSLENLEGGNDAVRVLVLAPTRELSEQVFSETQKLAGNDELRFALLVGGRPIHKQINDLQRGVGGVIGTPGRVIDLLRRRCLNLDQLEIVVLDEADRMLD